MSKQKLYVVVDENNYIVGITEDKKVAKQFIKERRKAKLNYVKITRLKDINYLLIENEDKIITEEPLLGILITQSEQKDFIDEIYFEIDRLKSVIRDLEHIRKRYDLPEEIEKNIKKGIKGIKKITSPVVFGEVFGLELLTKAIITDKNILKGYERK